MAKKHKSQKPPAQSTPTVDPPVGAQAASTAGQSQASGQPGNPPSSATGATPRIDPQPNPDVQPPSAQSTPTVDNDLVEVVCRRSIEFGGQQFERGDVIAEIELAGGVTLNNLVDAIRNGFASDNPGR